MRLPGMLVLWGCITKLQAGELSADAYFLILLEDKVHGQGGAGSVSGEGSLPGLQRTPFHCVHAWPFFCT